MLVVNGTCRTGKVIDMVNFDEKGKNYIMTDKLKAGMAEQMLNIPFCTGKEDINTDNFVSSLEKTVNEV